jgi:hypothetical protein
MLKAIAAFIFFVVVFAALVGNKGPEKAEPPKPAPHTVTIPPPPEPRTLVTISDFNWAKGGFGNVGLGTFTIKNDNTFQVKDVAIRCDFYANSGTSLSRADATIYEVVAAKKSRTFREVNLGFIHSQSSKASCRVISVSR